MRSERVFTCIICPNGCNITTVLEDGVVVEVKGHTCPRGEEYVRQEVLDPRRTIASTVRIEGAALPLCSVRLDRPIPKKDIFRVMEQIDGITLWAPVKIGQIVIENVCGLDSDVIVTKNMEAVE